MNSQFYARRVLRLATGAAMCEPREREEYAAGKADALTDA
jgi:hypothetical protein